MSGWIGLSFVAPSEGALFRRAGVSRSLPETPRTVAHLVWLSLGAVKTFRW